MASLILIGIFYVFTSYASAIGWGTGNMAAFATNANPYYALGHSLWGGGWWFIFIAIINSAVGVGLACTNAASRVTYTMGKAGTLPARFAKIHPVHRTPTYAIAVLQITGIVAILLVGILLNPNVIFGFLGTITTLAVIVLYIMANLALTAYIRREHPGDYSFWRHGVVPWIGTLALLPVFFITVWPIPPWPFNLTPVLLHRGADRRIRLHAVARDQEPWLAGPGRDDAGRAGRQRRGGCRLGHPGRPGLPRPAGRQYRLPSGG